MESVPSTLVTQLFEASDSFIRTGKAANWEPGPMSPRPHPEDPTRPLGVLWESFILTVALEGDTPEVDQRIMAEPFESPGFRTVFEAFKAARRWVNNELIELHHLRFFGKTGEREFVTERERRANDLGRVLDYPRSSSKDGKAILLRREAAQHLRAHGKLPAWQ